MYNLNHNQELSLGLDGKNNNTIFFFWLHFGVWILNVISLVRTLGVGGVVGKENMTH